MRVVSLQPSATEILALIGGAHLLVGRSHECDFPSDLNGVPIVTSSSLTFHSSGQVDTEVEDVCVRRNVYLSCTIGIPWLRHPCARCYKLSPDSGTNVNDTEAWLNELYKIDCTKEAWLNELYKSRCGRRCRAARLRSSTRLMPRYCANCNPTSSSAKASALCARLTCRQFTELPKLWIPCPISST